MVHSLFPDLSTALRALCLIFFSCSLTIVLAFDRCVASTRRSFRRARKAAARKAKANNDHDAIIVGFFHPKCSAGGGGERVLWKSIEAMGEMDEERRHKGRRGLSVVIYTADAPSESYERDLREHVRSRFSIVLSESLPLSFVHLSEEFKTLSAKKPRRLTMVVESLETMYLTWAALTKRVDVDECSKGGGGASQSSPMRLPPDVFFDTTGCAFTYPVAKLLTGCKVGAYVHYPTISTDMLSLVWERRPTYNNDTAVASSTFVTYVKLAYYALFALCYGAAGSLADVVMVNSSWTEGHVRYMWRWCKGGKVRVVYPPVDTKSLETLGHGKDDPKRERWVVSIGQFRPEKDHALQLRSFALLLDKLKLKLGEEPDAANTKAREEVRIILIGSCRDDDDRRRVDDLRRLARDLGIKSRVDFVLNQPYAVLETYLRRSSVGVHTMWNEHFGIGVVEMMAAGLVTVAHDSGGPKSDIVVPLRGGATGRLATTAEEYANAMRDVLLQAGGEEEESEETGELRRNARESARRFSDEVFAESFKRAVTESSLLE